MKYFFFTYVGDSFPIAYKLKQEGFEVTVGVVENEADTHANGEGKVDPEDKISRERRLSLYDGMITKMPAWELVEKLKHIENHSECFLFFDRNNLFKFADPLREYGFHGNSPTLEDYIFEQSRDIAKEFVRKHYPHLKVAEVHDFKKISEAKKFLATTNQLWVLKGKTDGATTFVPDVTDPALAAHQITQQLESDAEDYEYGGFILELLISPMIEITPEKMYYDGVPIALTIDFENKPFGSGNTSIQTGCSQDMVFPIPFESKINEIAFPPIVDEIARKRKGLFFWDASLLINKKTGDMYFGEFCSNRPGYNTIFTELAQCPSIHHFFESIVERKNPFTLGTVGTSVSIYNPATDEKHSCHPPRNAAISFAPNVEKNLWLWDVYKKGKNLVSAGDDKNLAVITGAATSINKAIDRMYKDVDDFSFVGSYWRPKFDYVSLEYPTSILNRLNYAIDQELFSVPFTIRVGDINGDSTEDS